jgi:hypothetical protein
MFLYGKIFLTCFFCNEIDQIIGMSLNFEVDCESEKIPVHYDRQNLSKKNAPSKLLFISTAQFLFPAKAFGRKPPLNMIFVGKWLH